MSQLAQNVHRMNNAELIGLAKNRFLEREAQIKIAEHPYRRAKSYLTENPGLVRSARDILWNTPGYVLKCELISFGHYSGDHNHKFYLHLYDNFASTMRQRSPWRLYRTFVGGHGWGTQGWGPLLGPKSTPPEILEKIYEQDIKGDPHDWSRTNSMRYLLENPNLPEEIVVKTSASDPNENIRTIALKRLGTLK